MINWPKYIFSKNSVLDILVSAPVTLSVCVHVTVISTLLMQISLGTTHMCVTKELYSELS